MAIVLVAAGVSATQSISADLHFVTEFQVADEIGTITIEAIEQIALASHPTLLRLEALVSAARGHAVQVGLQPNPELGLEGQQLGSDGIAEQYGVFAAQRIVQPEKLRLNRAIAAAEVRRAIQELAAQRLRIVTDVRVAAIGVQRAEMQVKRIEELQQIAKSAASHAEALLKASEVGRIDLLQAELEIEATHILTANAANRLQMARQRLAAAVGSPVAWTTPIAGVLTVDSAAREFETTLNRVRSESPEVAAVVAEVERAQANLCRQQIEPRPDVDVRGLFNWRDNGVDGDSNAGLAVSIPIPLWNRNQGAIHQARQQLFAAQRELSVVELDLQDRLAPVYERYASSREQVARYEQVILPKAAETIELMQTAYRLGELSYVNLLTAQRTNAQTQIDYLDSLERIAVAEAEMRGLLLAGVFSTR